VGGRRGWGDSGGQGWARLTWTDHPGAGPTAAATTATACPPAELSYGTIVIFRAEPARLRKASRAPSRDSQRYNVVRQKRATKTPRPTRLLADAAPRNSPGPLTEDADQGPNLFAPCFFSDTPPLPPLPPHSSPRSTIIFCSLGGGLIPPPPLSSPLHLARRCDRGLIAAHQASEELYEVPSPPFGNVSLLHLHRRPRAAPSLPTSLAYAFISIIVCDVKASASSCRYEIPERGMALHVRVDRPSLPHPFFFLGLARATARPAAMMAHPSHTLVGIAMLASRPQRLLLDRGLQLAGFLRPPALDQGADMIGRAESGRRRPDDGHWEFT